MDIEVDMYVGDEYNKYYSNYYNQRTDYQFKGGKEYTYDITVKNTKITDSGMLALLEWETGSTRNFWMQK